MKKIKVSYLNFITGILFAIVSILYFISNSSSNKVSGLIFLCLGFTFIAQGIVNRKSEK